MTIEFNATTFRANPAFSFFADETAYPNEVLELYFELATNYISNENSCILKPKSREYALNLMLCHIAKIAIDAENDEMTVTTTSASVGGVSVSVQALVSDNDQYSRWLNLTTYGQQLDALLNSSAVGGFYIGGSPALGNYRKNNGRF